MQGQQEHSQEVLLLVLLELRGGNDGLNTVAPVRDPLYQQARPTLALRDALPLADGLALHPALWSIPLCVGLSLIIYHRIRIDLKAGLSIWPQLGRRTARASDPPSR